MTKTLTSLKEMLPFMEEAGWLQFECSLSRSTLMNFVEALTNPVLFDAKQANPLSTYLVLTGEPEKEFPSTAAYHASAQPKPNDIPISLTKVPFASGLAGYLSYDYGESVTIDSLPDNAIDTRTQQQGPSLPAFQLRQFSWSYVYDLTEQKGYLTFSGTCSDGARRCISEKLLGAMESLPIDTITEQHPPRLSQISQFRDTYTPEWQKSSSFARYADSFRRIKEYILAGDCYQTNLTQRFEASWDEKQSLVALYSSLYDHSEAPFSCFYQINETQHILSFSPERFIQIDQRKICSRPIKGTANSHEKTMLLNSLKDQAENLMIVDLIRNDLGKVCKTGSIQVPELFKIEEHGHLSHMVSTVTGTLKDDISELDALIACFPGGSITGAPKIRAMEIIRELEENRRSIYCGSLFLLSDTGYLDSNILIRTIAHDHDALYCWSGGGIVHDSTLEGEYQESLNKVRHLTAIDS